MNIQMMSLTAWSGLLAGTVANGIDQGFGLIEQKYAKAQFPAHIYSYATIFRKMFNSLPNIGGQPGTFFLKAPIVEEISMRLCLQDVLLKRIPSTALTALGFDGESLMNSLAAQVTRVSLTAMAFALLHVHTIEENLGHESRLRTRIAYTFVLGVINGVLQETTGNIAYPIIFHSFFNYSATCKSLLNSLKNYRASIK